MRRYAIMVRIKASTHGSGQTPTRDIQRWIGPSHNLASLWNTGYYN